MLDTKGILMDICDFFLMFNEHSCPIVASDIGTDSAVYRIGLPKCPFKQLPVPFGCLRQRTIDVTQQEQNVIHMEINTFVTEYAAYYDAAYSIKAIWVQDPRDCPLGSVPIMKCQLLVAAITVLLYKIQVYLMWRDTLTVDDVNL